ncbi:MAG: ATP-binding cassette domain-containing protein [Prevotellaceae bacterium]|jgi:molybdate transport system ATP-binding protein|nr:ATP-binding cassette domain-containing protein [Prevotellaceae bacterium]
MIKIENASFRKNGKIIFPDTVWEMKEGENWAVTGTNGSGKTSFLEIIDGKSVIIDGEIKYGFDVSRIASLYFNDPLIRYENFYYQQRYNSTEMEGIITVRDFIGYDEYDKLETIRSGFAEAIGVRQLLDLEIIKLSNGQLKKMLIIKALMKKPRLLLLDNLYTGLDRQSREYISETLANIIESGTNIVMTTETGCIPKTIDRILEVENCCISKTYTLKSYHEAAPAVRKRDLPSFLPVPDKSFDIIFQFNDVSIVYFGKTVVNKINWTVRQGEKWVLSGPNGSGKTMLLSLVFADNPQSYSNNIILFDRKRGTGESIWDIKDNTGFVSPEMHLCLRKNQTCNDVILSALSENPYNKIKPTVEILKYINGLTDYFSISKICNKPFAQVSTGEQSVILLIKALAKNPSVLLLDEPFQGMDTQTIVAAKQLIDAFCKNRTLIFISHTQEEIPKGMKEFKINC